MRGGARFRRRFRGWRLAHRLLTTAHGGHEQQERHNQDDDREELTFLEPATEFREQGSNCHGNWNRLASGKAVVFKLLRRCPLIARPPLPPRLPPPAAAPSVRRRRGSRHT